VTAPGRILGLDAGERRIGVAISDPDRSFALPLRSVLADGRELDSLSLLIDAEGVAEIVVGLPLSLSGDDSAQTANAREFAQRLEQRFGLPVHLWDERLSTHEALRLADEPRGGRGDRSRRRKQQSPPVDTDAIAASIILQAYLDRQRFQRGS
jgi:putative Holliday junction resolvase